MPGPIPSGKDYGKYLDDRRAAETAAAGARRFMDSKQQNQTPANQQEEDDKSLRAGLVALGKMDKSKGATMTAEPGSSIEAVQQYSAQQPASPATDSWVPEPPMEQLPDESGLTQGMPSEVGVKFDPAIHEQPAVVDEANMPPPQTVDPAAGLPPDNSVPPGAATAFGKYVSQASEKELREAKAAANNPDILKAKVEKGEELGLPEKIAWIGMLVAPVALGFALRGEKGAYLGGMAAGKGLEKLGEGMTEKEKQESKFAQEEKMALIDGEEKRKLEEEKAKKSGDKYNVSIGKGLDIGGKSVAATIYAPKNPGEGGSIIEPMTYKGQDVKALMYDEQSGLLRSQVPDLKPNKETVGTKGPSGEMTVEVPPTQYYYKAPEGEKTLSDELRDIGIPPAIVSNPEWLKVTRAHGSSLEPRQGIDMVPKDAGKRVDFFTTGLNKILADKNEADRKKEEKVAEIKSQKDSKWNDRAYEQVKAEYNTKEGPIAILRNSLNTTKSSMDAGAQILNDKFQSRGDGEGVRQTKILYAFIKAEDPTTAVREGEIDLARSASPLAAKLGNYWNKLVRGDLMPKETVDAMERALQARQVINYANAHNAIKKIKEKADRYGIPHDTFTDSYVESMIEKAPQDYAKMNIPNAAKYKTDEQFQREVFVKLPVGGIFIHKGTPYMKTDVFDKNGKETGRFTSTSLLD